MLKPRTVLSFLVKFSWAAALSTAGETLAESSKQDSSEVLHIAAFGDSITRAFNADGPVDHPWNSWATGNSDEVGLFRRGHVKSHAELLSELTGKQVYVHNVAKSGAKSGDLARQVDAVKNIPVHYATMLIGANDLCANGKPIGDGMHTTLTLKFSWLASQTCHDFSALEAARHVRQDGRHLAFAKICCAMEFRPKNSVFSNVNGNQLTKTLNP
jgi:hypothetical protein